MTPIRNARDPRAPGPAAAWDDPPMETAPRDRIKLHLRRAELGGGAYSVLMPRPSSPYRVATRARGDGWTIVSDAAGAGFLARLVWAASYQQRPRTLVLLDGVSVRPDPVDGAASLPIVIVNAALDVPTPDECAELRARLPLTSSAPGSVRLVTHGLDRALADPKHYLEEWRAETEGQGSRHRHRFAEVGGVLLFAAPPAVLRRWAFDASRMVAGLEHVAGGERTESGQLQVIPDLWAGTAEPGPEPEPDRASGGPDAARGAGSADASPAPVAEPARRVLWQAPAEGPGA